MPAVERWAAKVFSSRRDGGDAPLGQDPPGRVDDLVPAAVVEGEDDGHVPVGPGQGLDPLELPERGRGDALPPADDLEPEVVLDEEPVVPDQVLPEEPPEPADLVAGPFPVLAREGEEGQDVDAEAGRGLDDLPDRRGAGLVALDPGQPPLPGPAAVAVHDHGDVAGQAVGIDLEEKAVLFGPRREKFLEVLLHRPPIIA